MSENYRWDDAVRRWQREKIWRSGETIRRENALLGWARPYLAGRDLDSITRIDLETLRERKAGEGAGARTCNYLMQTITGILRAAVRWEWIDRAPMLERIPERTVRESFLTLAQASKLLMALPLHLRTLAEFSLETGLRQSNARLLEWRHVQLEANRLYFPAAETKNRTPLLVPLTPAALAILHACRGQHARYVFTYKNRPMLQPRNTAWYRAVESVGMTGVRWHDLRHTWASWHMAAGTNALVLQKLGGWKTMQMVARYTHLDDSSAQHAVRGFGQFCKTAKRPKQSGQRSG